MTKGRSRCSGRTRPQRASSHLQQPVAPRRQASWGVATFTPSKPSESATSISSASSQPLYQRTSEKNETLPFRLSLWSLEVHQVVNECGEFHCGDVVLIDVSRSRSASARGKVWPRLPENPTQQTSALQCQTHNKSGVQKTSVHTTHECSTGLLPNRHLSWHCRHICRLQHIRVEESTGGSLEMRGMICLYCQTGVSSTVESESEAPPLARNAIIPVAVVTQECPPHSR